MIKKIIFVLVKCALVSALVFAICFGLYFLSDYFLPKEVEYDMSYVDGTEIVLFAKDRRLIQGKKIKYDDLVYASDERGNSLSDYTYFSDEAGNKLSGYIKTDKPCKMDIYISVKNPNSGLVQKRKICVLVDGKVTL